MSNDVNTIGLIALIASAKSQGCDLPEDLLRRAYDIELKYQYEKDKDRLVPIQELGALIEEFSEKFGK